MNDLREWINVLNPVILAVLVYLVIPVIRSYIRELRLRNFADTSVGISEEAGRNHIKENGNNKMDPTAKKAMARNHTKRMAQQAGYKITDEEADRLIESSLGTLALRKKR